MFLTREDFQLVVETALTELDRDEDPRPLAEWFLSFARNLRQVAHDVVPGLVDDDTDLQEAWNDDPDSEGSEWL